MRPLKRTTLSEQIMHAVLSYIAEHDLRINDQMPTEKELSEALHVGRNSIREVMKTLNLAGITESIPGKGTFLLKNAKDISYDPASIMQAVDGASLLELIEVRRIIETEAAALAAARAKDDRVQFEELERMYHVLMQALQDEKEDVSAEGFDFHMAIVRLSGNHLLYQMLFSIVSDIRKAKQRVRLDLEHIEFEKQIHARIFSAIAAGNPALARAAMQEHFANTQSHYHDYVQKI